MTLSAAHVYLMAELLTSNQYSLSYTTACEYWALSLAFYVFYDDIEGVSLVTLTHRYSHELLEHLGADLRNGSLGDFVVVQSSLIVYSGLINSCVQGAALEPKGLNSAHFHLHRNASSQSQNSGVVTLTSPKVTKALMH